MTKTEDGFEELQKTIDAMVAGLSPSNRSKAMATIAKKLREINRRRIKNQTDPTGKPFEPRKKKKPFRPETQMKFIYPSSSGKDGKKVVQLTSWSLTAALITGTDKYSNGRVKSYSRQKIIKYLPTDEPADGLTDGIKKRMATNAIKDKMFKKLVTNRFFKVKNSPDRAETGILTGMPARIARVHQEGGMDIVSKKDRHKIKYPERQLLGITLDDEQEIVAAISKIIDYDDV